MSSPPSPPASRGSTAGSGQDERAELETLAGGIGLQRDRERHRRRARPRPPARRRPRGDRHGRADASTTIAAAARTSLDRRRRAARHEPRAARAARRTSPPPRAGDRRDLRRRGDRGRLLAGGCRPSALDRRVVGALLRGAPRRDHRPPDPLRPPAAAAAHLPRGEGARPGDRPPAAPLDARGALAGLRAARPLEGTRLRRARAHRPRLARPRRAARRTTSSSPTPTSSASASTPGFSSRRTPAGRSPPSSSPGSSGSATTSPPRSRSRPTTSTTRRSSRQAGSAGQRSSSATTSPRSSTSSTRCSRHERPAAGWAWHTHRLICGRDRSSRWPRLGEDARRASDGSGYEPPTVITQQDRPRVGYDSDELLRWTSIERASSSTCGS